MRTVPATDAHSFLPLTTLGPMEATFPLPNPAPFV